MSVPKGCVLTSSSPQGSQGCHSEGSHAPGPGTTTSPCKCFVLIYGSLNQQLFKVPFNPPFLIKEKEDADSASGHPGFQSIAGGQKGKSPIKLFAILMAPYKKGSSHNQPYLLQAVTLPGWQDDLLDTALVAYECI